MFTINKKRITTIHSGNDSVNYISFMEMHRIALFCCALVIIMFFSMIYGIRFVTHDDLVIANTFSNGEWFRVAYGTSVGQGRLISPIILTAFIPYLIDHPFYFTITRYCMIILAVLLTAQILRKTIPIASVVILYCLLFFSFAQNSWDHNPFTAYPFVFEAAWVTLLIAILILIEAIKRQDMRYAVIGAAIYVLGLYEAFLPYIFLLCVIALKEQVSVRNKWRYLFPYLVGLGIWLIMHLWWRWVHPSQYPGTQLANLSLWRVGATILNYGLGGAPLATILFNKAGNISLQALYTNFSVVWVLKAICVFVGIIQLARLITHEERWRPNWLVFACVAITIFLPVCLIALTQQYQHWMDLGVHRYVYSHYSYYAWTALVTIIWVSLLQRFRSMWFVTLVASLGASTSFITDWSNAEVNAQQHLSARRWETFDRFLASSEFRSLPAHTTIFYRGLDIARGIAAINSDDFAHYALGKTGKEVIFSKSLQVAKTSVNFYYLYFYEEPEGENQYILFAPIMNTNNEDDYIPFQSFTIYPNTLNTSLTMSGSLPCKLDDCLATIIVNGESNDIYFDQSFALQAAPQKDANGIPRIYVQLPRYTDVSLLWGSFARTIPTVPSVSVQLGNGFNGWEENGVINWNWASTKSEIEVHNDLGRTVNIKLNLTLAAYDDRTVEFSNEEGKIFSQVTLPSAGTVKHQFTCVLKPGVTRILLRSNMPPINPGNGDPRIMTFQVRDITLRYGQVN